jgi:hypothetical protein
MKLPAFPGLPPGISLHQILAQAQVVTTVLAEVTAGSCADCACSACQQLRGLELARQLLRKEP